MSAVGTERISTVLGYAFEAVDFNDNTPNLPMFISLLGEVNDANQLTYPTDPKEVTSAQQAGELYGFGSPIYHAMRILRPISGGGVGGIKTKVFPQAAAAGATSKIITITPSGTATGNGLHRVKVSGRFGMDGETYSVNVNTGDGATEISQKIVDAVNGVTGCPVSGTVDTGTAVLESKWKGLTAEDITITVDTEVGGTLGLAYGYADTQSGSATPDVAAVLATFGNKWVTIVVNLYGNVASVLDALEGFNGKPDPTNPTGRYAGINFKPLVAFYGDTDDDPTTVTDARKLELTNVLAPAPLSLGLPLEAAANAAVLEALIAQNTPHLDVQNQYYPDMPTPLAIGSMSEYENRDAFVKKGASTVDLNQGLYQIKDLITSYHPDGELPPQHRYVRNLILDWNIAFRYKLLEEEFVLGHAIANDSDVVTATKTIRPKQWKAILFGFADDLAADGIIVDADFMKENISVAIDTDNPDRFNTTFKYKRTGYVRIAAATAQGGFNFGNVN